MRTKFLIYASLGLIAAASIAVAATFAYAASGQVALVKTNIKIQSDSIDLVYNGTIQQVNCGKPSYYGELNIGDGFTYQQSKLNVFEPATYSNSFNYQIINANGKDVTNEYNIVEEFGQVNVRKRKLDISIIDESIITSLKDGKNEIEAQYLRIGGDGPASTDSIIYYCNKKNSGNGTYTLSYSINSVNNNGRNTTNFYTVNKEPLYLNPDELAEWLPPGTSLPDISDDSFPGLDGKLEFDGIGMEGDFGAIPGLNEEQLKLAIMKVKSDKRGFFLLRGGSFGDYNYDTFNQASPYDLSNDEFNPNQYFTNYLKENKKERSLEIKYLNNFSTNVDFAPYFCSNTEKQANDLNFAFPKNQDGIYTVNSYDFSADTNLDALKELSFYHPTFEYEELRYRNYVHETYLKMPDPYYKTELIRFLTSQGIGQDLSLQQFNVALKKMFKRDFQYNIEPFNGDSDTVTEFLNNIKIGNCTNFAGASTMLYRAIGVPARYTTGFAFVNPNPGKWTVVVPLQAHAWTEIYIDGFGWIPLDYTPIDVNGILGEGVLEEIPDIDDPNDSGILGDANLNITEKETIGYDYLCNVQVNEPGKYYLRQESYGDFELDKFGPANQYKVGDNTNPNHFVGDALREIGKPISPIKISYRDNFLGKHMLVPTYEDSYSYIITDCDLYAQPLAIAPVTTEQSCYNFDYFTDRVDLENYTISDPLRRDEELKYYYYAMKNYLNVPEDIKAIVKDLLLEYAPVIPESPSLIIDLITKYFKQSTAVFSPTLNYDFKEIIEDLEGFLKNNSIQCNSKMVAGVATLLLRTLNVPTRLVKGYLYVAKDSQEWALSEFNEYFWNEVYIKGLGWVTIDFLSTSEKLDEKYYEGKKEITIKTDDANYIFDDENKEFNAPYIVEDALKEGHYLDYENPEPMASVGEKIQEFKYTIREFTQFEDVSYEYAIHEEFGRMTIQEANIVIHLKNIKASIKEHPSIKTEIDYIECDQFDISELVFLFEGTTLNNVGKVEAYIYEDTFEIRNALGHLITENFNITIISGSLELY